MLGFYGHLIIDEGYIEPVVAHARRSPGRQARALRSARTWLAKSLIDLEQNRWRLDISPPVYIAPKWFAWAHRELDV
jgi:hypothetical protein